jgi:hypothetical protein
MIIWDGVGVVIRSKQGLTVLERFVIECLLTLGQCRAEELREIASIPPELCNWLLSGLTQKELAQQEDNWFSPNRDACTRALAEKCLLVEHTATRSFLWFPETHELVVIPDAGNLMRQLCDVYPLNEFPLPPEWENVTRGQVIRAAMDGGRLYGDHAGVISEVNDNDSSKIESCPAYQCRATVPHNGIDQWQLAITGYRKPRSRTKSSKEGTNTSGEDVVEQVLPVPILPELARSWHQRFELAGDAINSRLKSCLGVADVRRHDQQLVGIMAEEAARNISRDYLLVNRRWLQVGLDNEIHCATPLLLQPLGTDQVAQRLFAVDGAVQRMLAARNVSEDVGSICLNAGVALEEAIDRLWQLRQFGTVYKLREMKDFAG